MLEIQSEGCEFESCVCGSTSLPLDVGWRNGQLVAANGFVLVMMLKNKVRISGRSYN